MNALLRCSGFEWDDGNRDKNWRKHGVSDAECEQVFFNQPLVAKADTEHSQGEDRYFALGRTDADRWLFTAFTIRHELIRIISAREMTRNEAREYGRHAKKNSKV